MVVVRTVLEIAQQHGIPMKIDRTPMKPPTLGLKRLSGLQETVAGHSRKIRELFPNWFGNIAE
jgi:hypothetical protein